MGLLDRFFNPIWYNVSKLDTNRQRIVAAIVCFYDFSRQEVYEKLVRPVESFLKKDDLTAKAISNGLTADLRAELRDEAFVGLLRCCKCPNHDPGGRLPATIVQALPETLGTFVLADINHRLHGRSPNVLEQTHYSKDPDEARTQVLTKWMEILGVATPSFVTRVNAGGFAKAWEELAQSFVGGMLKGSSRAPDEVLLSKARRVAAQIPPHRASIIMYIIERLASAAVHDDHPAFNQRPKAPQEKSKGPAPQQDGGAKIRATSETAMNGTPGAQGRATQHSETSLRQSPERVAEIIAGRIAEAFSSTRFSDLFKEQTLSEGWTLDDALAVWYSLGHLALVVAAWQAYKEKEKVFRITKHCRPMLVKQWNVSEDVFDKLRALLRTHRI